MLNKTASNLKLDALGDYAIDTDIRLHTRCLFSRRMAEKEKLHLIEVKGGRLPEGVSGKDLTGPLVLMTDGQLPAGWSEARLAQIGATVLAVQSGDEPPLFLTRSHAQHFLQRGVSEAQLEKAGFILIADEVVTRGQAEAERAIISTVKDFSKETIQQELMRRQKEIQDLEERLQAIQQTKSTEKVREHSEEAHLIERLMVLRQITDQLVHL